MNRLMIDDAMVALGPSGEFAEGRVEEFIGRTGPVADAGEAWVRRDRRGAGPGGGD